MLFITLSVKIDLPSEEKEQYQAPIIYRIFRDLFFDQSIIYQK